MSKQTHITDVVVIGAGPVGLFTVFEAGMLSMRCHVVDTLTEVGGQCAALYPEKPIYDIAGFPSIAAQTLIDQLKEQAAPFHPTYHLGERVEKITKLSDTDWQVTTSKETVIMCKAIVIAAGCGAFGPNRPPLDNLDAFEDKSVFYKVTRREDFAGKSLVIAGGGDSAVDWAISLADIAKKIYVVHRRAKFRCAPESAVRLEALAKGNVVEMVIPYQLDSLIGNNGVLESVRAKTLQGEARDLPADALLAFFGLSMELGPIAQWGLNLDEHFIAVDPATMMTNTHGVFGVGDIITYPGKRKLIVCGFSEAAMAAHAIYPLVHPGQALHFEYSTNKGVPA